MDKLIKRDANGRFIRGNKINTGRKQSEKTKKVISEKKKGCPTWNNGITYCKDFHIKSGLHLNLKKGGN